MTEELTYDQRIALRNSFMTAVSTGDLGAMTRLLQEGFDINEPDWEGETAVINAAFYNQPEALRLLIRAGADPDRHENQGSTALICAAAHRHTRCVEALIDGFANLNEADFAGNTPLWHAQHAGHEEVALLLKEALATESTRRGEAAVKLQQPLRVGRPPALRKGAP